MPDPLSEETLTNWYTRRDMTPWGRRLIDALRAVRQDLAECRSHNNEWIGSLRRIAELEQSLAIMADQILDDAKERDELEQDLARVTKWVNLGGAPSGRKCNWDPKDIHEVHGPGYTLADGTEICLIHEIRRLTEQAQRDRERIAELSLALEALWNMPPPSHIGSCGPESGCDGICVDRANIVQLVRAALAKEPPR